MKILFSLVFCFQIIFSWNIKAQEARYWKKQKRKLDPIELKNLYETIENQKDSLSFYKARINGPVKYPYFNDSEALAQTYDRDSKIDQATRKKIYEWYLCGEWLKLDSSFKANQLNKGWPPANGANNIQQKPIVAGQIFDRYSMVLASKDSLNFPNLGGTFTSPVIQKRHFSYEQRALNQDSTTYDLFFQIEVLQDLPFICEEAEIIPWFGKVGKGIQAEWKIPKENKYPKTWNQLANEGYIRLRVISSPNGKFKNWVGKSYP